MSDSEHRAISTAPDSADNANLRQWRISFDLTVAAALLAVLVFSFAGMLTGSRQGRLTLFEAINPNTACAASLVRLPGIGPAKAAGIIEYREKFGRESPAFRCPQDLDSVSGIGPKTVEKMEDWLTFEER